MQPPDRDEPQPDDAAVPAVPSPGEIPGPESNVTPGRIRQQDESTTARAETVAEARARQKAQRERIEEQERLAREAADAAQKKARRRKQMIGAGVGVGVVGTIALLYVAVSGGGDGDQQPTQQATCTRDGQVVADSYCSSGTISPVTGFILLNGMSYRYNYGGSINNGRIVGGSYDRPANTTFRTPSGGTIDSSKATSFGSNGQSNVNTKPAVPNAGKNISRGGLGANKAGSSGGGSKSGGS